MDIEKLNFIKKDVLKTEIVEKPVSDEFAGVYLISNRPFNPNEDIPPNHAFRAFSEKKYPIYFFVSSDVINNELKDFAQKIGNIRVMLIPKLTDIQAFNNFSINSLLNYIDEKHEKLLFYQNDGFLIKSGFEEKCAGYSWLGSVWKEDIQVVENTFNYPPIRVGNGGANFRRRSKCLEVYNLVNKYGGQQKIVKGLKIGGQIRTNDWFLAEDAFWCHFGFGSGIFEPVNINYANSFAKEPITMVEYQTDPKPCFLFHRIDE